MLVQRRWLIDAALLLGPTHNGRLAVDFLSLDADGQFFAYQRRIAEHLKPIETADANRE
jgi:hypothetical protein